MADPRYFKLRDDIGVEPDFVTDTKTGEPVENPKAGELSPLRSENITLAVPTMVDDQVVSVVETVTLEPIPGTRILKIDDPLIANAVAELGKYDEVEPPSKSDLSAARHETEAGRQRATKSEGEE